RDADDRELARQEPVGLQVVERGEELALGQVPGGAEDDDGAGPRHSQRARLDRHAGRPAADAFDRPATGPSAPISHQARSVSATLHAWAMAPRGANGASPSKLSAMLPRP